MVRMRSCSVDVGVIPIAEKIGWESAKRLEVDFVCNMGSVRYYIQSAYSFCQMKQSAFQKSDRLEGLATL